MDRLPPGQQCVETDEDERALEDFMEAIEQAQAGDRITFHGRLKNQEIVLDSAIRLNQQMTIDGDLDNDGNVLEAVPVDRDFKRRFIDNLGAPDVGFGDPGDALVDMGAYERGMN